MQGQYYNPSSPLRDELPGRLETLSPQSSVLSPEAKRLSTRLELTRPVWTAAAMPLFVFGEGRYVLLGLAVVALLWAGAGIGTGVWWRRSLADPCLLALLLMVPVTLWVTPFLDLTGEHVGYFLAEVIALVSVATWANSERRVYAVAWGLVGVACLLALSAPLVMEQTGVIFSGPTPGHPLALPETIQKNVMGGVLVAALPVGLGLLAGLWNELEARVSLAGAVTASLLIAGAIAFTQSRGAYIAALACVLVLASVRWRALRWAGPAILGIMGLAAWSGQLDQLMSRLLQSDSVGDFVIRGEIWSRAVQALHDYPLTGIGMGAFRSVVPSLYPYVLSDSAKVHHAHNLYLQVGADLGLPGLVGFVALALVLAVIGYVGRRRWAAAGNPRMAWLAAGCLAGLAAILTHGLFDAVTWGTKPAFLAWAVLGLLLATALTRPSREA